MQEQGRSQAEQAQLTTDTAIYILQELQEEHRWHWSTRVAVILLILHNVMRRYISESVYSSFGRQHLRHEVRDTESYW